MSLTLVVPSEPELGPQRLCFGCREWWPFDAEFWHLRKRPDGRVWSYSRCRACRLAEPHVTIEARYPCGHPREASNTVIHSAGRDRPDRARCKECHLAIGRRTYRRAQEARNAGASALRST